MKHTQIDERPSGISQGAAWYAVFMLLLAYILALLDRVILSIMVDPIQQDLHLSDLQIGLLQGYVFAIFYALAGLPIGRLVDSHNRRSILAIGVAMWSVMTMLSGFSRHFLHLFAARIGVGVGEAVLSPVAGSMLADYFPKDKLARALAVYMTGAALGPGIGFALGGSIYSLMALYAPVTLPGLGLFTAWQLTFIVVGLPGLLLALMFMTVREPQRGGGGTHKAGTLRDLGSYLYTSRHGLSYLFLFTGVSTMMHAAFINWMPTVMTRRHNMPIGEVGLDMGIVVGIGALIGYWGGGWLADYWLSKGKKDAHLRVGLVAGIGLGPMAIGAVLSPDASWSLFFTGGVFVFATLSASAGLAGLQLVTPSTLRGQVTALYILVASLVGVGTGPFLVGFLTDVVFGSKNAVHFSLLTTSLIAVPLMIGTSLFGLKPFGQLMKSREAMA